jgi:hypothetical protein
MTRRSLAMAAASFVFVSAQALAKTGTRCLKSALGSGNFGPMHP